MEVLKGKQAFVRARMLRGKHVRIDDKPAIQAAGTIVEIPLVNWQEMMTDCGGLENLEWLDIPDEADYEVQVQEAYKTAAHPDQALPYAAGAVTSFTKEQALRYMLDAGRIKPISKDVPDIGIFCSLRYRLDRLGPGGKSAAEQQKERLLHERFEAFEKDLKERLSWIRRRGRRT
ncbi:hypothetical protein NBG4_890011 [Candidatus Sulfobium mesophilum]|uniref:Uncharacterized protein n=1 Tax=Candidatus Sulfobium mesophilum TaxID=2016548 RepID=A0A2U3QKW6_9BACT|nr:hypothetical protein NBG4_890011 [Candidatus Sulfobium mesophilum]